MNDRVLYTGTPYTDPSLLSGTVFMALSDWSLSLGRLKSCDINMFPATTEYYCALLGIHNIQ